MSNVCAPNLFSVPWHPARCATTEREHRHLVRRPVAPSRSVYPLLGFPEDKRNEIAVAAAGEEIPDRWLHVIGGAISSRAWFEWHLRRGRDPDKERPPLPRWLRDRVIERDGFTCHLCGGDVERGDVHIDHVVAWSKGGPTTLENLRVAHSLCNIRKGAR